MTAKQYLKQINSVDTRINNKLEQVERLKSLRERVTATLTGMPKGSGQTSGIADITVRIFELERQINEDIDMLIDLKEDARRRIEALSDERYKAILEARYFNNQSFEQIADGMSYEMQTVYNLHGHALQKIDVPGKSE